MHSSTRQAIACIFAIFSVALAAHAQSIPSKEPGATITGKVTVKGKGAPGVIVAIRENEMTRSGREYSGPKGVTDDDGNYRIVNVSPGSYRVLAVAKAFAPAGEADREKIVVVNKGETIENINFALVRGGVITGKVVDAEGRPIVEEGVYVTRPDNGFIPVQSYGLTDDRGIYRIYGLPAGSYRVAAGRGEEHFSGGVARPYRRTYHPSVNDASQATIIEISEGGEAKDVDIIFTRTVSTYTVRGRIVDGETGQPLANVEYGITRYEEKNTSSRSGGYVTNSRGEFKVENLAPGKYGIPVSTRSDSDLRFEEAPFEIIDRDVTDLVIKGTKSGSISGVVVFEGTDDKTLRENGRTWIMAAIDGSAGRSRASSTQIGVDGSFHIRGVPAGTATLYLHSNGNVRIDRIERDGVIQPRGLVMREREHLTGLRVVAQVGNASVRGKIEVENGTLPADAQFFVQAKPLGEEPGNRFSASNIRTQVDARGQFVIDGLTPGTYEIEAGVYLTSAKLGYLAKKQQIVVTAGSTTTVNITVDLNSTPIKP